MVSNAGSAQRSAAYVQLWGIVAALIAVLWGAIHFDLTRTNDQAFAKSRDDLRNLALTSAKDIESSIKEIDVTLLDLRDRWLEDPTRFSIAVRNRQAYLQRDMTFQVGVIDANGILVFSNLEQTTKPVDLSDREHFRIHRTRSTDELFVSKPLLGRVSKRWSVQFTRPIFDSEAKFAGVLVLSVAPEYFYQFIRSSALPEGGVFNLVRSSGEFLSRFPDPDQALGKAMKHTPYLDALSLDAGFHEENSQIDSVARLYAWRKIGRYRLAVAIGQSLDSILATYRAQRYRLMLAGSGLTFLLLVIAYLNMRAIGLRQKVTDKLHANEERWRLALEAAGDGVWDWNIPAGRVDFSHGWKSMLGYAQEDIGDSLEEWKTRVHPDDMERVMHDLKEHIEGRTYTYRNEHRIRCKDGSWKWILDRGMVILRDKAGAPVRMVGTHTDIAARKALEHALKNLATTDSLTGLDNRRSFLETLDGELARIKRYPGVQASLLMADVDHFKKVNDTYGHSTGDAMLKHIASILRSSARRTDFIGRLGGEEFAILLTETGIDNARHYAQALCQTVRESPLEVDGQTISVTISIGLTRLMQEDEAIEITLHRADMALYEAKDAGRNRVMVKDENPLRAFRAAVAGRCG
ncbi:diguanylate cyclase [Noviherbaspirillum agri]